MKEISYNYVLDTITTEMGYIYDFVFEILEDTADRIDVVIKVKMLAKIKLLQKFIEILSKYDTDHFFSNIDLSNEKTSNLYREILEGFFESQDKDRPTFNTLWNRILLLHNIEDDSQYLHAKIKAYAIWRSLCEVYPLGEAYIAEEYHIAPDQTIEDVMVATCDNSRLDTLFKILKSNFLPPAFHTWENAHDPADFLLSVSTPPHTNEASPNEVVQWNMNGLTLSDLWRHNQIGSTLNFSSLSAGINNYWIHREIASAMTWLYWGFTRVTPANRVVYKLSSQQEEIIKEFHETIKDPLKSTAQSSVDNLNLDPWERIALKKGLIVPIQDHPRIYRLTGRSSVSVFLGALRDAIREEYNIASRGIDATTQLAAYMPTNPTLYEMVYNRDGKQYAKRTYQKTAYRK